MMKDDLLVFRRIHINQRSAGNLWHFWKTHEASNQRRDRCLWMATQCYELALALRFIHTVYGIHGHAKAESILWLEWDDILVMSDFGLNRLRADIFGGINSKKVDPSFSTIRNIYRSATYCAPKSDIRGSRISPTSDIYSLGCVFLEFVTWYLEGWQSVNDDFPDRRLEEDVHGFVSDTFFRIEGNPGDPGTPVIKPEVKEWIEKLKRNSKCSQYLVDFLDLIQSEMLHSDSQHRIKSPRLVNKLHVFAETCRHDSSYYMDSVSSSTYLD